MINVTVGSNLDRKTVPADINDTLRETFESAGISYASGTNTLDGAPLSVGDIDKTFAELGIRDNTKCFLLSVVKADNA